MDDNKAESKYGWHHGYYGRFLLLRILLALVILGIVFFVGVQVGEFKAAFWGFDGYGHHEFYRSMPYGNMMYGTYGSYGTPLPGQGMMYFNQTVPPVNQPTNTAPKK